MANLWLKPKPQGHQYQFNDELQILARKVISIYPEWKSWVDEALKIHLLTGCGSILAAITHILLKSIDKGMPFNKFWAEYVSMFGNLKENENLRAAKNQHLGLKHFVEAMIQAMICMYMTKKETTPQNMSTKPPEDKVGFLEEETTSISQRPQPDPSLPSWQCKLLGTSW